MENNKKELDLTKKTARERLDLYGIEWSEKKATMGNDAKRQLFIQIAEEAYKLFVPSYANEDSENIHDALVKVLMDDVRCKFDLSKSSDMQLSRYISSQLKRKKIEIYRKQHGRTSNIESDTPFDKIVKHNLRNPISLDVPIDEDGELELGDTIASNSYEMKNMEFSINAADLFEMIVSALRMQRLRGKTMEFYRVIYTSDIISAEKGFEAELFRFQHQKMIDEELSEGFVNYCMVDKCEGVEDIYYTALKLYGEVVSDTGIYQKDETIPLPMEDKVGVEFLKTSKGNYSKYHTKYKELVASIIK